ncbi:bifunctional 4-hydroxy-2-oxoglutarate aldolase/2-dehydro-3-deoxy-phosphogluconate aldolase [Synechococcus sp. MU1642]|uniref:bifunctional 4-hydroxy-2-oxoglutarate aldolase/2-dehydro-3-deoxy-phosphogluconate aldolase n=1 Tax=Synechococcus sp. MU1642 TaxID=2508348 RepID=UPI001CF8AF64
MRQELFVASLQHQPLLLVIRPEPDDLEASGSGSGLLEQVQQLHAAGLRHLEVAWLDQPGWIGFMQRVQDHCPELNLGAASVTVTKALNDLSRLDLSYAMAPCWCPELVEQARGFGVLLVPGVFSPTEVHQAMRFGCRVVKLFPAVNLGPGYWGSLQAPLGPLPFVIAAGGLEVGDLPVWLEAGHGAVALGRRVVGSPPAFKAILDWLHQSTSQR